MSLHAGERLGAYEILALIGAGGMGEVYRAHDTKLKRDVALKVLPEAFARDPDRMARFQREAEVLASLNHPNIAVIYGVEEHALVMELVEGESPKGPMAFEEAWKICSQIAEGLEYAHEKRVVHRDLKPANVKVTPEGRVKILDFGLAKAFTGEPGRPASAGVDSPTLTMGATQAGVILGTAAYMAPEQVRGKEADRRADIWAFGVVLYELLTGERLFKGADSSETMARVLTAEPGLEQAPANVKRLLGSCLEKDPHKRLRDIGDAWRLLEAETPVPNRDRQGVLWWKVAAAALLVVSAAVSFLYFRQTPSAPQPLTRFSVGLGPDAVAGLRITAAISPDGRRLAFVARGPGGKEQLATRLLDQSNYTLLAGTDNPSDPFFSPDSQWIGFFADRKMKKISVQGGAAVTLCDAPNGRGASWGEDGNIIVTPDLTIESGLVRVPAAGGAPQVLTKPNKNGETTHRWPQILPGGQAVLFTDTGVAGAFEDGTIKVFSFKTGQRKIVQPGGYFGRYVPSGHLVYVHQGTLLAVPFDLDRLEVRGTPVPVLEDVAGNPATAGGQFDFSRNGAFVYLSGKSSAQYPIAWMDSAGKMQTLLAAPGNYYTPRFSPDGRRLAFSVNLVTLQVYDWQRDTTARISFGQPAITPVWTPDGRHIVFATLSSATSSLQWIRSDGAQEAERLFESKYQLRPYSFSPDGKRLAFTEDNPETSSDLWTLPLDLSDPEQPKPGKPEPFLRTPARESEPAFSPDGRWIAYQSQESGSLEVQVRPFPGPGGKWLISTTAAGHPVWSRDGHELFFVNPNDGRIWVVTYTTRGDTFIPDKPRLWSDAQIVEPNFQFWNLDMAPDGKRFAVFPRPDAGDERKGSVHVTVLLNFFDELRRRVPTSGK